MLASLPGPERVLPLALRPLNGLPAPLVSQIVPRLAEIFLSEPLGDGELEPLEGRRFDLFVEDIPFRCAFTMEGGRLVWSRHEQPDVTIRGETLAFLALAGGAMDADTLFFRRRICVEGDVALGLTVKNLLDGYQPHLQLPTPLRHLLETMAGRAAAQLHRQGPAAH